MGSHNGSIHTTHTPPPLSFYNTFKCLDYVTRGKGEGSGLWKLSEGHKWPLGNSLSTHAWGGGRMLLTSKSLNVTCKKET